MYLGQQGSQCTLMKNKCQCNQNKKQETWSQKKGNGKYIVSDCEETGGTIVVYTI